MTREEFNVFAEERNIALFSGDFETFKAFYMKYVNHPDFDLMEVDDWMLQIVWHKMIAESPKATVKQRIAAKLWLRKNGIGAKR